MVNRDFPNWNTRRESNEGRKLRKTEISRTVGQYQRYNISIIGIQKERENCIKEISELIMAENFKKLMTDTKSQLTERTPNCQLWHIWTTTKN